MQIEFWVENYFTVFPLLIFYSTELVRCPASISKVFPSTLNLNKELKNALLLSFNLKIVFLTFIIPVKFKSKGINAPFVILYTWGVKVFLCFLQAGLKPVFLGQG